MLCSWGVKAGFSYFFNRFIYFFAFSSLPIVPEYSHSSDILVMKLILVIVTVS